jgi:Rrf2 family protein
MTGNSRFAVCVHILAYLAYRQGESVTSAEIASSVDTNPVVIRRLLAALVKAGLVATRKGAGGGFSLAIKPADCTLLQIYRVVEPAPSQGLKRFNPNQKCPVGAKIETILHKVYAEAQAGMEAPLGAVTLAAIHEQLRPVCTGKH